MAYTIGVVYLATGLYSTFWNDFYFSCERFFCPEAEKVYFVFTDKLLSCKEKKSQVYLNIIEDEGWLINTCSKSKYILSIREELVNYDFVFYFNANLKFQEQILCADILPKKEDNYLVALSFHIYDQIEPSEYPYDRNYICQAYIPFSEGIHYYQGEFYGGRTFEILNLSEWICHSTREDLEKGIIAKAHDESYLNKYFILYPPKKCDTSICKPEEWGFPVDCKAVLQDKNRILGSNYLSNLKAPFLNKSLNFLYNENYKLTPLSLVNIKCGLGNQMFQYAFFQALSQKEKDVYLNIEYCTPELFHNGYELKNVFGIPDKWVVPDGILSEIKKADPFIIGYVEEDANSSYQEFKHNDCLVTIYDGYWQTEKYFALLKDVTRKIFTFDKLRLNTKSLLLHEEIQDQPNSVSIHIRRGDYLNNYLSKYMYGGICTLDYYKSAMRLLEKKIKTPIRYYIFSDEPEWVKENFNILGSKVVDCNRREDSWQDMCLMSACRHHIIANSSFSWWGAWLGGNKDKIVIAPDRWLTTEETPDILPDKWIKIPMKKDLPQLDLSDTTFLIPIRVDSKEREENLDTVLEFIYSCAKASVIILEADESRKYLFKKEYPDATYLFIKDQNPVFHRTYYLNRMLCYAQTPIVGIWDTDVILPIEQINEALNGIRSNKAVMSFPYDGHCFNVTESISGRYKQEKKISILKRSMHNFSLAFGGQSFGGAFFVDREKYISSGGENESFYGWGSEDLERVKRMEILCLPVYRSYGPLFHLYHPRKENSFYVNGEIEIKNKKELLKVCQMTKEELIAFIKTWGWAKHTDKDGTTSTNS